MMCIFIQSIFVEFATLRCNELIFSFQSESYHGHHVQCQRRCPVSCSLPRIIQTKKTLLQTRDKLTSSEAEDFDHQAGTPGQKPGMAKLSLLATFRA